jgi:predicted short-subunit dehydrogenase-like oxidoreductase (DUF2520 family)
MLKVVVIGSGNVAQHLVQAFENSAQVMLVQAYARHPEQIEHLLPANRITEHLQYLAEADIYIISVTDDAIAEVSSQLPFSDRLVVHTSGSVAMEEINDKNRRGVFYPLQTFTKNKPVDFFSVPFCLETEDEKDYAMLEQLASAISGNVYKIDSQQRRSLHVAAVFVSNFVNHMYMIGNKICDEHNISFNILKPLIKETADKINSLPPLQAQTGPARRNDMKTIEKHLDFLKDENQKAIYALITKSIHEANV